MLEPPRLPPDPPRRHESHDDVGWEKQAGMSVALEGLGCVTWGLLGPAIALGAIAVAVVAAIAAGLRGRANG